jgi:hypothetical protein
VARVLPKSYLLVPLTYFLLISSVSKAQLDTSELKGPDIDFVVRGKAMTFFVIEDAYFMTANVGLGIIINKRHTFGVDVNYFRWRYENEEPDAKMVSK